MKVPDYYQILEVKRNATAPEIKRAFRRLAKRYHPDKNPEQIAFAEQMFREVCRAYSTLRNEKQKSAYDRTLHTIERQRKAREAYLEKLSKLNQSYAKLELLLEALLHQNYEIGISLYEQLCHNNQETDKEWRIDDFLSYEESRDYEFLIAEAYQNLGFSNGDSSSTFERHRKINQAMLMYESLLSAEAKRPCFRNFTREVKDRLKFIYLYHFSVDGYDQTSHIPLTKIRALKLPKRETAWMYKKIAEFYVEIDQLSEARTVLKMAFELQPRLTGAKKICRTLNMEE
ncbi:MAG: DnaJ domain-containing protein [Candidatus Poribacteria bacterium]|nr:DnaJ domain-containing protein [Candidatus Poribacteria bacterium]